MNAHPQIFNKYFVQKIIQPSTWPIVFSFQLCFESYSTLFSVTISLSIFVGLVIFPTLIVVRPWLCDCVVIVQYSTHLDKVAFMRVWMVGLLYAVVTYLLSSRNVLQERTVLQDFIYKGLLQLETERKFNENLV